MILIDIQPDPGRLIEEQDELVLLALNCRQEARGEMSLSARYLSAQDPSALEEELAVACVVMNRSARRRQSVRQVILAPKQFSWLLDSDPGRKNAADFIAAGPSTADSWKTARAAAVLAYYRIAPDITGGADHYHADYVHPPWADTMKKVSTWGRHLFYDSARHP